MYLSMSLQHSWRNPIIMYSCFINQFIITVDCQTTYNVVVEDRMKKRAYARDVPTSIKKTPHLHVLSPYINV